MRKGECNLRFCKVAERVQWECETAEAAVGEYAKGFHEPLSGGSVTSVSGWEEAEGEGRGGGRENEGENEMGGGGATMGGGCHSTCLPNRCRAEGVTRPHLLG